MPEPPWTVFVVDDDAPVRDSLAFLLEAAGFPVRTFASAEAFLDALRPDWQGCLLTDVRMPGLSGVELQETLSRRGVELPVIVMTGHGDVPLAVRAMKAGAVDFLEKPFDDAQLIERLEQCRAEDAARRARRAARARRREALERLTPRERQVLACLVAGKPNKIIAAELGISPRTVEVHRARVLEKLGARSLPELVRIALEAGFDEAGSGEVGAGT